MNFWIWGTFRDVLGCLFHIFPLGASPQMEMELVEVPELVQTVTAQAGLRHLTSFSSVWYIGSVGFCGAKPLFWHSVGAVMTDDSQLYWKRKNTYDTLEFFFFVLFFVHFVVSMCFLWFCSWVQRATGHEFWDVPNCTTTSNDSHSEVPVVPKLLKPTLDDLLRLGGLFNARRWLVADIASGHFLGPRFLPSIFFSLSGIG